MALTWLTSEVLRARPARADTGALPKTCDRAAAEGDLLLGYQDPAGRFTMRVPCGWTQVTELFEGGPVVASFYNPEEPGAETLAVYLAPVAAQDTRDLGSAQDVARALAQAAPNGQLLEGYALQGEGAGGGGAGRTYYVAHVQFGGNTAGKFGAARELRCVAVDRGVQYTLRITTTRYRYLADQEVARLMKGAVESLRLTPA